MQQPPQPRAFGFPGREVPLESTPGDAGAGPDACDSGAIPTLADGLGKGLPPRPTSREEWLLCLAEFY